jgi:hypothetical protein
MSLYWLSTPRATGLVITDRDGIITGGCPYFQKAYRGQYLRGLFNDNRHRGWQLFRYGTKKRTSKFL